MAFALSPERDEQLQQILSRYPDRQAACIPVLHLCQEQNGWISEEVIQWVAEALELSTAHVLGVATFYSRLSTEPMGIHRIGVCRTLSCALRGGEQILRHCEKRLGIRCGQTTEDGKVSLVATECMASCGTAPAIQVDREVHEGLTIDQVDAILDRLAAEAESAPKGA